LLYYQSIINLKFKFIYYKEILMIKTLIAMFILLLQFHVSAYNITDKDVALTNKQVRALQSLNANQQQTSDNRGNIKTISLKVSKLTDNQGQTYLGAIVSRAELAVYLNQLEKLLGEEFQQYRAFQAARDHQLFHMTLVSPPEYQLADKAVVEKLLASDVNGELSRQININLLGLGTVARDNNKTYFVVAQSVDGQSIRQHFLLKNKDFHITLGFKPSDIYSVTKDSTTLIK